MAINLLNLQPHKVSRDLSGYITYIFGPGKVGKTTFGSKMPGALILAFEKGYNALPNVYAQDVTSWSEMKMALRELKKPEVKEIFHSVIIDTVDIAAAACEKYIISQAGVDTLNQIPYGQGWTRVKREMEDTFRAVTQQGYAVLFISHDKDKTFTRQDGTTYNQIVPTLGNSYNEIVKDMVDIYGYAHVVVREGQPRRVLTLRSLDNTIDCGSRFKYMKSEIDFSYDSLVAALNEAIDEEAKHTGAEFVTNDRNTGGTKVELNYDELIKEFNSIIQPLTADEEKMKNYYAPRITEIIEKYLGKGKKINNATRDQVEQISLIVYDLKELINSNQ